MPSRWPPETNRFNPVLPLLLVVEDEVLPKPGAVVAVAVAVAAPTTTSPASSVTAAAATAVSIPATRASTVATGAPSFSTVF